MQQYVPLYRVYLINEVNDNFKVHRTRLPHNILANFTSLSRFTMHPRMHECASQL